MAYTAYESDAGELLATVQANCRHAARLQGAFGADTVPRLVDVERWITSSYYWINGLLTRHSYTVPEDAVAVINILQELQTLDVCIKVDASLPASAESGEPSARFQLWVDRRAEIMEMISDGTIFGLGAVQTGTAIQPIVTGYRVARKQVAYNDSDIVQARARRGQFSAPGTDYPD